MIDKKYLTPREIANRYPCSEWCISFWTRLQDRPLPSIKYPNGHVVIEADKFQAWYLLYVNPKNGRLKHLKHKRKKEQ